jgi:hypothetical protein
MKANKTIFLIAAILLAGISLYAQSGPNVPPIEPSYEVKLQVIVGSNEAGQNNLPSNLRGGIAEQLRSNFGFPDYHLDSTFVGRIGTNGTFEYKSVSNTVGADSETPTFLEWTLGTLRTAANEKGQTAFQAQPFRFGARVPIKVSTFTESGKTISNTSYESVGLTVNRVSLAENTPTLIGTLSLPKTAGTLFLVLTVKPAQ